MACLGKFTTNTSDIGSGGDADDELAVTLRDAHDRFHAAMDDDFNTAVAIAALFELGLRGLIPESGDADDIVVAGESEGDRLADLAGETGDEDALAFHGRRA